MKIIEKMRTEIDKGGALIPVDIEGCVHYFIDRSYGADADGNRGIMNTVVSEVTGIRAFDDDMNQLELSVKEEDFLGDQLTRKFLEG